MDELAMLEAQANAIDAEVIAADPSAPPPEIEAVPVDAATEISALVQTVAALLSPVFPCLPTIYTDAVSKRLGEAAAPVLDKYGLTVGGFFDEWGPEIGLFAAVVPLAVATAKGMKADMDKRTKPAPQPEAEDAPPPSSDVPASSSLAWGAH